MPQWVEQQRREKATKAALVEKVVHATDAPKSTNTANTDLLGRREAAGFVGKLLEGSVASFLPNEFKRPKLI